MRGPGVITLLTPELEEPFLKTLAHEEVWAFPSSTCLHVLVVESGECLVGGPLDADPFDRVWRSLRLRAIAAVLVLDGQLAIHIVLNLLNRRVPPAFTILSPWLVALLKPVGYFENVTALQFFIQLILLVFGISSLWFCARGFCKLPIKDLFVCQNRYVCHA